MPHNIYFQPSGENGGLGAQANGGGGHAVLAVGKVFHLSFKEAVKNLAFFPLWGYPPPLPLIR